MNLMELLLGQIPEAIYFALFMIFTKQLKEKRILYILLMIGEYLILKLFFKFNIYFQVSYTVFTYIILKLLYREKSQITDVFTFTISSIVLIIISAFSYTIISATFGVKLFTEFAQKMIQEVESPEAKQVIKKHLRKISQMSGM